MTENGDKFVTHKDFIGYQDKLFEAINRHSERVIETVDKRLSDIVYRLGIVEAIQKECNKDVAPVIKRHRFFDKLILAVATAIVLGMGGIVVKLIKIGDILSGL